MGLTPKISYDKSRHVSEIMDGIDDFPFSQQIDTNLFFLVFHDRVTKTERDLCHQMENTDWC